MTRTDFYCVKNKVRKEIVTESFKRYCELRDDAKKAFNITKNCQRKWMNQKDETRGSSGIVILWPDPNNQDFKDALAVAEDGDSPNNISAIIKYELNGGVVALWMGDLETAFMEAIEDELTLPKVDLLFAPHHGRKSGRVPASLLKTMDPRIIIVGEAPCEELAYYADYNKITQNTAGDIVFECESGALHVFTSKPYDADFLVDCRKAKAGYHYAGSLTVGNR